MKHTIDYIKKYPWLLLLIIPAFFIYLLIIFRSGSYYCFSGKCGIYFWGVHGHDGIWHLAIANAAFNKIPFVAPTFAGALLSGYNYFFDLVVNFLTRIGIPAIISYFKILPVAWFIIYTIFLIILARKIKDSPLFVGLLLFFSYFSESFSYLFTLYRKGTIWGASGFLATLKVHMMSNPPFAFSILIILAILIIIKNNKINMKTIVVLGLLNFLSLGLKFYGGVITTFLIGIYIFFTFVKNDRKKLVIYALIQLLFFVTAVLLFYDPISSFKSGAIFSFSPFALIHPITEEPDLFYLRKITDARYYLISRGVGPKLILIELLNLILFLFFYLGVKFFGLIYIGIKILKRKISRLDTYILLTMIFATILASTLVQKAEWWNVVQFFYYAIFLSSIFLAELTYRLLQTKKFKILFLSLVAIIAVLSLPVTLDVIREYSAIPGTTYISEGELAGLNYLKKQPAGIVFAPLYDKSWKNQSGLKELYRYADTAYIAAFTNKQEYFANILQLRLTGVSYESRLKKIENSDCRLLDEVTYLYQNNDFPISRKWFECSRKLKRIFNNQATTIYTVEK